MESEFNEKIQLAMQELKERNADMMKPFIKGPDHQLFEIEFKTELDNLNEKHLEQKAEWAKQHQAMLSKFEQLSGSYQVMKSNSVLTKQMIKTIIQYFDQFQKLVVPDSRENSRLAIGSTERLPDKKKEASNIASNIVKKLQVMQHKLSKSSLARLSDTQLNQTFKKNTYSSKDLVLMNHSIDSHCSLTSIDNGDQLKQNNYYT